MNLILPAVIVGGYLYISNMKSTGDKLQRCEISSFKLGKLKMLNAQEIIIPVELQVFNPNNTDVPAEYFRGTVKRAGIKIGDFSFDSGTKNIMLKRRGTTPLIFNIRITTIGTVRNIINALKNLFAARPVDTVFTVDGTIAIGGFDIPISFSYDIKTDKLVQKIGGAHGIGKPYAKMEFGSNREMEEYFNEGCKKKIPSFSKN